MSRYFRFRSDNSISMEGTTKITYHSDIRDHNIAPINYDIKTIEKYKGSTMNIEYNNIQYYLFCKYKRKRTQYRKFAEMTPVIKKTSICDIYDIEGFKNFVAYLNLKIHK